MENLIKKVEDLFTRFFGEEHFELTPREDYKEQHNLTIFYPSIEIVNSNGLKRTLINLFVRLIIEVDEEFNTIKLIKFRGRRTSLFPDEFCSNYQHSHLTTVRMNEGWLDFCIGSGDFGMLFGDLSTHQDFDEDRWELFLNMVDDFVRWESDEGGPYIRMENIMLNGTHSVLDSSIILDVDNVINNHSTDIKYILSSRSRYFIRATLTDESLLAIAKHVNNHQYRNRFNNYVDISANPQEIIDSLVVRPGRLKFKDQVFNYEIIKEKTEEQEKKQDEKPKYPHIRIIAKIQEHVTNHLKFEYKRSFKQRLEHSIYHRFKKREDDYRKGGIFNDSSLVL